jgi:hypothetical protein
VIFVKEAPGCSRGCALKGLGRNPDVESKAEYSSQCPEKNANVRTNQKVSKE